MPEISILLLGETDRPEFCDFRLTLETLGRVCRVSEAERAIEVLEAGEIIPDVIVIAQAFPQQFSHGHIDLLRRLAPLSRILVLLGSWCEGETRSGQPLPGVIRIYWHQWRARAERDLRRLNQSQCPSWGLPVTATDEERLLESAAQTFGQRSGSIAIHTQGFAAEDWLSAACRMQGYSTIRLRPSHYTRIEGLAAVIFDGTDLQGEELEKLRHLTHTFEHAPVIALLDFTRIEDQRRALSAGATAVLSKPLYLDDLLWQLDEAVEGKQTSYASA